MIFKQPPKSKDPKTKLCSVSKKYGNLNALDQFELEIDDGITCLLG